MDKKRLLAEATRRLDRRAAPAPGAGHVPAAPAKARPVVSKGITLRPGNVEKLDRLELSLRQQGIKAGHSGLIQLAIDRLEDDGQLAAAYRELLKLDLRLR